MQWLCLLLLDFAVSRHVPFEDSSQDVPWSGDSTKTLPSLKLTVRTRKQAGPQKETIVFQPSIFGCYVSFREGMLFIQYRGKMKPFDPLLIGVVLQCWLNHVPTNRQLIVKTIFAMMKNTSIEHHYVTNGCTSGITRFEVKGSRIVRFFHAWAAWLVYYD